MFSHGGMNVVVSIEASPQYLCDGCNRRHATAATVTEVVPVGRPRTGVQDRRLVLITAEVDAQCRTLHFCSETFEQCERKYIAPKRAQKEAA